MQTDKEPIATLVVLNRGTRQFMVRRQRSGLEIPLDQLGGIRLKVYRDDPFISIDLERGIVWIDMGAED